MNKEHSIPENEKSGGKKFESDTQKLVRQHMEDKNHNITEEDIRNVRIGLSSSIQDIGEEKEELVQKNKSETGHTGKL